jgi:hypothetical protein
VRNKLSALISVFEEVGMEAPGYATAPDGLTTGGAGTCITVAFLDATGGEAALIHSAGMAHTSALEDFLRTLQYPAESEVYVVIAGGDTSDDARDGTNVAADRVYVERAVRNAFPAIGQRWFGMTVDG